MDQVDRANVGWFVAHRRRMMELYKRALWILMLGSCFPGAERGVSSPCDTSHPCRSFLRCSSEGRCILPSDDPPDANADAPDAPDAPDAQFDADPAVDAKPPIDATSAVAPDAREADGSPSGIATTCNLGGQGPPASPVRGGQEIICHDHPENCGLLRGIAAWPTNSIPVCALGTGELGSDAAGFIEGIRAELDSTWGRWIPVTFTGWQPCACAPAGTIALLLDDPEGDRAAAGYSSDLAVLVSFDKGKENLSQRVSFAFGRALGVVDASSFAPVSTGEILRGQRVYGMKAGGSLVDGRGRCLKGGPEAPVVTRCEERLAFSWRFASGGTLVNMADPYPCVTRVGNSAGTGMGNCGSADALKVSMNDVQWRALANMCVKARSATVGATMVINACDENDRLSRWDFITEHSAIRLSNSELCVTTPSNARLGDVLDLRPCLFDQPQRFLFERSQVLAGDYCFNVGGGKPVEGQPLILWNGCHQSGVDEDKIFFFRGRPRAPQGCFSSAASILGDVPLSLDACVSSASNVWEYRW